MNEISIIIILKPGYFQMWFLYKSDYAHSTAGKNKVIIVNL